MPISFILSMPGGSTANHLVPNERWWSDPRSASAHPLCSPRRRPRAGPLALDRFPFQLPVYRSRCSAASFEASLSRDCERLFAHGQLRFFGDCIQLAEGKRFASFLRELYRQDWVVYAKPPFGGPSHVLHYLARYTHRVAISNHRLLSVSTSEVHFRWKDYAHGSKQRTMTLTSNEFLRHFVQHVLPRGFPRIRYFGWLSNRRRTRILPLCRARLNQAPLCC